MHGWMGEAEAKTDDAQMKIDPNEAFRLCPMHAVAEIAEIASSLLP